MTKISRSFAVSGAAIFVIGTILVSAGSISPASLTATERANRGNSGIEYDAPVEPVVKTKTETTTQQIPFETIYIDDNSIAKGQTKVLTEGANGVETTTYRVTYTDGVETSREVIETKVTRQPIAQRVARGTYVKPSTSCPNGTYVNSAGATVCRSAATNTGGATAVCRDGSYSYSQNRRGTCSHHGGVARWL